MPRCLTLCVLLLLIAASSGCEAIGYVASAFEDKKKPAVYNLPKRATLILVDDPAGELRDPQLLQIVAARATTDLKASGVVPKLIEPAEVVALQLKLGKDFLKMPVDRIGRELGADQVIHAHVRAASVTGEPGTLKPVASIWVKVIDVTDRRRLFPPSAQKAGEPDKAASEGAYVLTVSIRLKTAAGIDPSRAVEQMRQTLANRIGSELARLFYAAEPDAADAMRP